MHPYCEHPDDALSRLGELGLLARLRTWLGPVAPPPPAGMGDDTAVLAAGTGNLLTTDSLVHGRHFDDLLPPELAGAKLLKRNLSDLAAMGGRPGVAVLAAFLPPKTSVRWLEAFVRGLAEAAATWEVAIVGGDLTETTAFLGFNLTLTGEASRPVLRGAARLGDELWVTGTLGDSLRGHHATFVPRLAEGAWLAAESEVRTMIDVTDGLGKDLPALLPPETAAALDLSALPLRFSSTTPAQAFTDGEDYELLFSADPAWSLGGGPARWATAFRTPLTRLGSVVPRPADAPEASFGTAPLLDAASGRPLSFGPGYAHFR
jgi:thiamine-monophosphate kinase